MESAPEIKPKRKYTRRQPPSPTAVGDDANALATALASPKSFDAPAHEYTCTIPIREYVKEAFNGDKVKAFEYCSHAAAWVPTIHLEGLRMDPDPRNIKKLAPTPTKVPVNFGPVCEEHKAAILKNIRILVNDSQMDNLGGEYNKQGFGDIIKAKTTITWAKFEPATAIEESGHIQALSQNILEG